MFHIYIISIISVFLGRHIVCLHRHFFCLRRHLEILGNPRAKKVSRIFKEPVLNYQVFKPFYARLGDKERPIGESERRESAQV